MPTFVAKVKNELKGKEKKRKKLKSRDNKQEKDKDRNFCDVSGFEHLRGQWDKVCTLNTLELPFFCFLILYLLHLDVNIVTKIHTPI